ncbi:MAG: TIGR00730 family Rossman fold protein [Pseudonocardiaceae bacterium]|nr:TIGR00730 family Rossman fold protein [Pseudonocardiaceae bacterium]
MRITVYCGSQMGRGQRYAEAARSLGRALAERGHPLVYGGAMVGTMGAIADAALDAGGEVIGVIPQGLVDREVAHTGLSELHVVADMHERKAKMAELAHAFVVLPGGAGTLEEFFEMWTWAQLGLHDKPIGLVDEGGYYQPLRRMIEHMVEEGFLRAEYRDMLRFDSDPWTLLVSLFRGYSTQKDSRA